MAILAAIWSTGPSLLLIVSTTVTRDFYHGVINKNATDRQQLNCTRLTALIIGIGASLLGMQASSILNSMLGAFQIRSVVGLVLVVALFWKRVNSHSAFWSMLFGGIVAAVWFFSGNPFGMSEDRDSYFDLELDCDDGDLGGYLGAWAKDETGWRCVASTIVDYCPNCGRRLKHA